MAQRFWKAQHFLGNCLLQKGSRTLVPIYSQCHPPAVTALLAFHPPPSRITVQNRARATAVHLDDGHLYDFPEDKLVSSKHEPPEAPGADRNSSWVNAKVNAINDFKININEADLISLTCQATRTTSPDFFSSRSHRATETTKKEEFPFWNGVALWSDISSENFISQKWQVKQSVDRKKIERFLLAVLPENIPQSKKNPLLHHIETKHDFIREAKAALEMAPMTIKLSPYILSCIDWNNPLDDPVRLQFIPLKSSIIPDHPSLTLDSLGEEGDSPVPGLVHRYEGKALFLSTSICPVYCSFCTRAYAVGPETSSTDKKPQKPSRERWEVMFKHIENDTSLQDIVVSGGDTYMLAPDHLRLIGERLLSIPHVLRFRIASKGLAVNPCRILDNSDAWASTLVDLAKQGRKIGKQVCWHTHFNHPNEITWITKKAALHLCQQGLTIRNQTVLLKGVNDDPGTMGTLIKKLADMNIEPYYVYICDLVKGIEHLRTPLQALLKLDKQLRGTITGFMMPDFVVDLPGGGGKRLAHTYESYCPETGVSTWRAPGLPGKKGQMTYTYYDPRPWTQSTENLLKLREQQDLMHKFKTTQEVKYDGEDEEAKPRGTWVGGTVMLDTTSSKINFEPSDYKKE